MTQVEKTEAVIKEIQESGNHAVFRLKDTIAHARDLAKRLDAVMAEIESPDDWDYEAGSRLERAQRALYPEYFQ